MVKSFRTNLLNWLQTKVYLKTEIDTKLNTKAGLDTATTSNNGLMSKSDKSKLDGVETGATKTIIDTSLSSSSTNPVQNKIINTALNNKANSSHTHDDRYYTESEVDAKFDALVGFEARVVSELPALGESGVLYLILDEAGESGNIYNEYIWVESSFELIGSTETKLVVDTSLSESSVNPVENRVVYEALAGKADIGHTHTGATSSNDGFLSSTDKVKLDSVEEGANKIIVDTSLSSTSTNPVANSVVYEKLGDIETILDEIIGV